MMKITTRIVRLAGVVAVSVAAAYGFALSTKTPAISMEQMTKEADSIVIGNVLSVEPVAVGRSLETRYQVAVHENLKGKSAGTAAGETMVVTLPGAALTTPPITQYVSGVPYLAQGEEVLLFLRNSSSSNRNPAKARSTTPKTGFAASPKIMGWNQGRFSVVTNPDTGKKMVTRINLENYGLLNTSKEMRQVLDAIAAKRLPLIEQQVIRSADYARDARIKDPLEMTTADQKKFQVDAAMQKGAVIKEMRQRGGIAAQHLDDFKAQIQAYLNE